MDKQDNNNVLSMRDYLEARQPKEQYGIGPGVKVIREFLRMSSNLNKNNKDSDKETFERISMTSIEDAIHYEYKATKEVIVSFESKEELFKVLKRIGLGELLRVKYCNLDNPVIKEFFESIKKED